MRSSFLLPLILANISSFAAADEIVIADFESLDYGDWKQEGNAFGSGPARGSLPGQQDVVGFHGNRLVNSFLNGDKGTGTLTSPEITISREHVSFLIGGGNHPGKSCIELLNDDAVVRTATGKNQEMLSWQSWDVSEFQGRQVRIRIADRSTDDFGHVNVDHIVAAENPRSGPGVLRLSEYRNTPEYYHEPYRPQFHFTPPINWMNDPNGLVFFKGEYHLFYQHNPHGDSWGHMSWGHAVSTDLVHWQHLPIALHEEYGVMIFSGCCVVDWKNTSGFGSNGEPPMIAIYTGHGLGKQTQDIAFSNDRGRTWTKYSDNPVIDKDESDFRDPKVFWHEPTQKWVMVVSMANAKFVQFYSSQDLKNWNHLSNFGPAGVKDKPNWECPDLFELPIEGQTGKTRWVLEVDMGNGAIAGGSGGEYFIGMFDGKEFKCDRDPNESQWVDYGRDFYAPVSFSDIPKSDGRRIWIGWMNNWETNLVPTRPWRSAMSIPRTLVLRQIANRLIMVQKPVNELQSLRGESTRLSDVKIETGEMPLAEKGIDGDRLEIIVEIEVGDAKEFGLEVRKGGDEKTVIGYDSVKQELFVDRMKSGDSSFHPRFAGRHAAPLVPIGNILKLHIFVDTSSVEVFGQDGEVVITERIFPNPESKSVSLYASAGTAYLKSLVVWDLESSWNK